MSVSADDSLLLAALKTLSKGKEVMTVALDECPASSDLESHRYFQDRTRHTPHLISSGFGCAHRNSGPSVYKLKAHKKNAIYVWCHLVNPTSLVHSAS